MDDKAKGIYQKFRVERTDGKSAAGEKHCDCRYFVIDIEHDEYADAALLAYADECEAEYPDLAEDLRNMSCPTMNLIT